jgi:leucyl/phenylalanyl-tRNA--protein transferase
MAIRIPQLPLRSDAAFPPVDQALQEPNGLLAFGGDLSPTRLLNAYRSGIFPWFSDGEPPLWWSPDPRMVVAPSSLHLSRRLRRTLRGSGWTARADCRFKEVISLCARLPRRGQDGTWITADMVYAYRELHALGHAHSIEVCDKDGALVGAVYGLAIGRVFFGESMFSLASGGSQAALAALCQRLSSWNFELLDGQVESDHLQRRGFTPISRDRFVATCRNACGDIAAASDWRERFGELTLAEIA